MKKFIKFIMTIVLIIVFTFVLFDVIYTTVFTQKINRGKIDLVYNTVSLSYDVIILGSSRANNHFATKFFENKGLKAFNYGMNGSILFESSLMLKLLVERKTKIKNLIVETDLNLLNEDRSKGIASRFLPYIHQSDIVKENFKKERDFKFLYYAPFYRYVAYDLQIGFRELILRLAHKKTIHLDNGGYIGLPKVQGSMEYDLNGKKPGRNKYYEEIKEICIANGINFIPVMTPICDNAKGTIFFKNVNSIYPEIHNYENVVQGNEYFSTCGHLNDAGAQLFTSRIIKDFFSK